MSFVLLPLSACVLALLLDRLLGEPKRHPLVAFGNAANWLETRLNNQMSKWRGLLAMLLVLVLPLLVIGLIQVKLTSAAFTFLFNVAILYFVIGWQSMKEHALAINDPLNEGEMEQARSNLAMIVSRQTETLSEREVVGSTIESVLENGHDCLFASLFWYALLGPYGALLHRLVNTLDAMWGYKNSCFNQFGFSAARLDDALGYLPARLTALCYAFTGQTKLAFQAWRNQMGKHKSPNAGLVMATGAGALNIKIGGPATYDGIVQQKPYLGMGEFATVQAIPQAISLIEKSIILWLALYALILFALSFLV